MAVVVRGFKRRVGKSREGGLDHGQFADALVVVGDAGIADLAKARAPLAVGAAHLPAAAGGIEQRLAEVAREKADAASNEEMGKMTSGLPLPPGFKLPF